MSKATATKAVEKPAAAVGRASKVTKKPIDWWTGAMKPGDVSTIRLLKTRPEWGGEYFEIQVSGEDGQRLADLGVKFMALESIKKRLVTLKTRVGGEEGPRWGFHKIRTTSSRRPYVHFPVEDGKFKTVESREDQNEIKLEFNGDKVTFELPASIR